MQRELEHAPRPDGQDDVNQLRAALPGHHTQTSTPSCSFTLTKNLHPLGVGQRLAGEFQDVRGGAHEDEQQLRELVARDSASQGQKPLSHYQQDEEDLVKSEDPVVGADGRQHLFEALHRKKRDADSSGHVFIVTTAVFGV